ncbi:hypothetical protein FB45DRAFT_874130 [Roridomyces roridus]|uniref:Uncharacterized protein n=1 Tax=Roridomyces roridus TaxID=1738132 RepID=A0AAD7B8D3_9AGAR|nr:hypothetical protein FB45DRAFT_874130 [Roridomyces roridus]
MIKDVLNHTDEDIERTPVFGSALRWWNPHRCLRGTTLQHKPRKEIYLKFSTAPSGVPLANNTTVGYHFHPNHSRSWPTAGVHSPAGLERISDGGNIHVREEITIATRRADKFARGLQSKVVDPPSAARLVLFLLSSTNFRQFENGWFENKNSSVAPGSSAGLGSITFFLGDAQSARLQVPSESACDVTRALALAFARSMLACNAFNCRFKFESHEAALKQLSSSSSFPPSWMSFISNASGINLGEGTFNNVHGNLVNVFHGDSPDLYDLGIGGFTRARRRETEIGGIQGRLLVSFEALGGDGVPFQRTAPSRHPNVLRIQGRSSPTSSYNFIAYENAFWKAAEGSLAVALKDDLERSIVLGFKLSGINYLDAQDLTVPPRVEVWSAIFLDGLHLDVRQNYNVFLDINDRFLFSIDFPPSNTDTSQPDDDTGASWNLFNALCEKVLRSANRVLHNEDIERASAALDFFSCPPPILEPSPVPLHNQANIQTGTEQATSKHDQEVPLVPPRREYVWRTLEVPQSLGRIATDITRDLEVRGRSINRLTRPDTLSVHRCPGYVREEITLTTRTADSAVVSHDTPAIQEVCSIQRLCFQPERPDMPRLRPAAKSGIGIRTR